MNIGNFQKVDTGLKGSIRTIGVTFAEVRLDKVTTAKRGQNSPDYKVIVRHAGNDFEVGAAWNKVSQDKKTKFISATMFEPTVMSQALNITLFERDDGKSYEGVCNPPQRS